MIKEIIYEYWQGSLPEIKSRDFNFKLIQSELINDVIGIRRAGKTYLLFFIIQYLLRQGGIDKKATLYINFENRKLYSVKGDYFNQIIEVIYAEKLLERFKKVYLFLDEIQNILDWQRYIRSIYDEFKSKIKIFISGSNAKLLGKEYAGLLTGRHLSINVFPLSFKEFLNFNNLLSTRTDVLEKERSLVKKALGDYIKFGGFPEVVLSSPKEEILTQYFSDIITRDVIFRQNLRKGLSVIEELGICLLNNTANLISFRKLTNFFCSKGAKISLPTLEHYFRLFEDAFLFFPVRIFSYKIKEQLQHPLKIYSIDTGLINALSHKFSADLGKLYENMVALELRRRKENIYYWKDYQHREVDFAVKENLKIKQLIQVCVDLEEARTQNREVENLIKASKELKCKNLFIINKDYNKKEIIKGKTINYVSLWRWLLGV
jgi:hypothetical protein